MTNPTPTPALADEREAFEKFDLDFYKGMDEKPIYEHLMGVYLDANVRQRFVYWRAGRRALLAPLEAVPQMQKSDQVHFAANGDEAKSLHPLLDAQWVQRLRETADHLRKNSLSLAKYPDMADEARARELAALYIAEIADTYIAIVALVNRTPARQEERPSAQCPACSGYGRINDRPDARSPYGPKCPTCGGSGRVLSSAESVSTPLPVQGQEAETLTDAKLRELLPYEDPANPLGDQWPVAFLNGFEFGFKTCRKLVPEAFAALRSSSAPTTKQGD